MLNVFPIQFLAPLTYFLLRITLGFVLLYIGKHLLTLPHKKSKALAPILIGIGISLIIGLYTQIGALVSLCYTGIGIGKRSKALYPYGRITYVLMTVIALSLFITGAGPFAFDLPI